LPAVDALPALRRLVASISLTLVAWAASGAAPPPKADAELDRVIRLWTAATGGLDRIRALRTIRMTGQITFGDKPPYPISVELARPGRIRTEVAFPEGRWIQIFDGRNGWIVSPSSGMRPMSAAELANAPEQADFEGPLVDTAKKGIHLALEGRESVDGRDAWRIRVTRPDGAVRYLDLDATTSFKVRWEGELGEGADRKMNASTFSDYRNVDGVTFPFAIASGIAGGEPGQRIAFDRIEVNPEISDARFSAPR
jgi:outer membrane lipoprotein-sorting protein